VLGSGLSTPKWPIFFTPTLVSVIFRSRSQRRVLLPLGFAKGAEKAIAVDIDDAYLQMVPEVKTHLEFHDLDIVKANVANQNDPADIVRSTFEQALTNNFKRYCYLGNISPTRRLYIRFQSRKVIRSWVPHLA
jgi:hypothetical protein